MAKRLSGYYIRTSFLGEEFGYSAKEMLEKFKIFDCEIKKQKGRYYILAEDAARCILDYGWLFHKLPPIYQTLVDNYKSEIEEPYIARCFYLSQNRFYDNEHRDETTAKYNSIRDRYISNLATDLVLRHRNGLMQVFDMNDIPLMAKELEDKKIRIV